MANKMEYSDGEVFDLNALTKSQAVELNQLDELKIELKTLSEKVSLNKDDKERFSIILQEIGQNKYPSFSDQPELSSYCNKVIGKFKEIDELKLSTESKRKLLGLKINVESYEEKTTNTIQNLLSSSNEELKGFKKSIFVSGEIYDSKSFKLQEIRLDIYIKPSSEAGKMDILIDDFGGDRTITGVPIDKKIGQDVIDFVSYNVESSFWNGTDMQFSDYETKKQQEKERVIARLFAYTTGDQRVFDANKTEIGGLYVYLSEKLNGAEELEQKLKTANKGIGILKNLSQGGSLSESNPKDFEKRLDEQNIELSKITLKEGFLTDEDINKIKINEIKEILNSLNNYKKNAELKDKINSFKRTMNSLMLKYNQGREQKTIKDQHLELESIYATVLGDSAEFNKALDIANKFKNMDIKALSTELEKTNKLISESEIAGQKEKIKEQKQNKSYILLSIQQKLSEENTIVRFNNGKIELYNIISKKNVVNDFSDEDLQAIGLLIGANGKEKFGIDYSNSVNGSLFQKITEEFPDISNGGTVWKYPEDFDTNGAKDKTLVMNNRQAFTTQLDKKIQELENQTNKDGKNEEKNLGKIQELQMLKISINKGGIDQDSLNVANETLNTGKGILNGTIDKAQLATDILMGKIPLMIGAGILYWIAGKLFDGDAAKAMQYLIMGTVGVKVGAEVVKGAGLDEEVNKLFGKPDDKTKPESALDNKIKTKYDSVKNAISTIIPSGISSDSAKAYSRMSVLRDEIGGLQPEKLERIFIIASNSPIYRSISIKDFDSGKNKLQDLFSKDEQALLMENSVSDEDIKEFIRISKMRNEDTNEEKLADLLIDGGRMSERVLDDTNYLDGIDRISTNSEIKKYVSGIEGIPLDVGNNRFSDEDYNNSPKATVQRILYTTNPGLGTKGANKVNESIKGTYGEKWTNDFKKFFGMDPLSIPLGLDKDSLKKVVKELSDLKSKPKFSSGSSNGKNLDGLIEIYGSLQEEVELKEEINDTNVANSNIWDSIGTGVNIGIEGGVGILTDILSDSKDAKKISSYIPTVDVSNLGNLDIVIDRYSKLTNNSYVDKKYPHIKPEIKKEILEMAKVIEFRLKSKKLELLGNSKADKKSKEDLIIDIVKNDPEKAREKFEEITSKISTILSIGDSDTLVGCLPKILMAQPYIEQIGFMNSIAPAKLSGLSEDQKLIIINLKSSKTIYERFRTKVNEKAKEYQVELDTGLTTKISSAKTIEDLQPIMVEHGTIYKNLTGDGVIKGLSNDIKGFLGVPPSGENKTVLESFMINTDKTFGIIPKFNFAGLGNDYKTKLEDRRIEISEKAKNLITSEFSKLDFNAPTLSIEAEVQKFANLKLKAVAYGVYTGDKNVFESQYKLKEDELTEYLINKINTSSTKTEIENNLSMFSKFKGFPFFEGENYDKLKYATESRLADIILNTKVSNNNLDPNIKKQIETIKTKYSSVSSITFGSDPTVYDIINALKGAVVVENRNGGDKKLIEKLESDYKILESLAKGDKVDELLERASIKASQGFDSIANSISSGATRLGGLHYKEFAKGVGETAGGLVGGTLEGVIKPLIDGAGSIITQLKSSEIDVVDGIVIFALALFFKK